MRWNTNRPLGRTSKSNLSTTHAASRLLGRTGTAACGKLEALEQRALLAVDLAYTTLDVANNVLPGGEIVVNSTLTNTGDQELATPFSVKFYLSADALLDGGDTELGTYDNVEVIPAAGILGFAKHLIIPGGTPEGNRFIIGVADSTAVVAETSEVNNDASDIFFVGNMPPAVDTPIVGPFTGMTRNSTLTILVLSATDSDNITGSLDLTFWYDVDGDSVLSEVTDRLIGAGQAGPSNSFVYSGPVPTFVQAGPGRIFAKAFDGLDSTVVSQTFTLDASNAPVVQALSASPSGSIAWGQPITFSATGVSDPDDSGTVQTVRLYRDSNGVAGLQADSDELIGAMTRDGATDRWTLATTVNPLWETTARFFAQATDTMDRVSQVTIGTNTPAGDIGTAVFTFTPTTPVTIASITGPGGNARRGREITLTANTVSGNATVVQFYRDSNGDGQLDPAVDQLLGNTAPVSGAAAFDVTIDPAWGSGSQRFFAFGVDSLGLEGGAVSFVQGLARNRAPRVASLDSSVGSASKGSRFTLTARNVTDDDGPANVEFYRDSNRNGRFDSADALLGLGTRSGSDWTFRFTVPTSFNNGVNKFFAKAVDVVGSRSATRAIDVTITRNTRPVITSFTATPDPVSIGNQLTLTARGVTDNGSIGSVQFFFDSNGNGRFDRNTDDLIGNGTKRGASRNWRLQLDVPAETPTGPQTFFAVAFDNLNVRSSALSRSVTINA